MDIYIYYRVDVAKAARLRAQVVAMQAQLAAQCSINTALKCRADQDPVAGAAQTWMEIYQDVPAAFLSVLQNAVERAGILQNTAGERHVETFVDMLACA